MVGEANDSFKIGEAIPSVLVLMFGKPVDPATIEPTPCMTWFKGALISISGEIERLCLFVLNNRKQNSAVSVVGAN